MTEHSRGRLVLMAACLLLVTCLAYIPALRAGFIWDDDDYVTENAALRSVEGLRSIWFDLGTTTQYYPLVYTTFWVEYQLWGVQPFGYHLVNVLLHVSVALLLWTVLRRLRVPGAYLAAFIFALHPVHVESVAWITERKNVLSGVFYMAALLAYLRFCPLNHEGPNGVGNQERAGTRCARSWYLAAIVLFAAALLSKTVTCSLPAGILLLLWWRRERLGARDLARLIPFFVLGAAMAFVTAWVEVHLVTAGREQWSLTWLQRILLAGRAVWFYLYKLVWPTDLVFIYPRWRIDVTNWALYLYPASAVAGLTVLWLRRRRWGRGPLAAALYFVGTLLPALGFFHVYFMRFTFVADHFQYLASAGPIVLFSALASRTGKGSLLENRCTPTDVRAGPSLLGLMAKPVVAGLLLTILAVRCFSQATTYLDPEILWRDTLARNADAWIAHNNLALVLEGRGQVKEAAAHYAKALEIRPDLPEAHANLGALLVEQGRTKEGLDHLIQAAQLAPRLYVARYNLATALLRQGRLDEAVREYQAALDIRPTDARTRFIYATVLERLGRTDEAAAAYRGVLRLDPHHVDAREALKRLRGHVD